MLIFNVNMSNPKPKKVYLILTLNFLSSDMQRRDNQLYALRSPQGGHQPSSLNVRKLNSNYLLPPRKLITDIVWSSMTYLDYPHLYS